MNENIKTYSEERKVILSEQMLEKIKYLLKGDLGYYHLRIEDYGSEWSYSFFTDITDSILRKSDITIKHLPSVDNKYGISLDRLLQLKSRYLQLMPMKDDKSFFRKKDIWYKYENGKLNEFCELIDVVYNLKFEVYLYYLTRDLIEAKNDCLINMKYFMSAEEIEKFSIEYDKAISEKNFLKMADLLNNVQRLILKEWDNYLGNIENMTDDNFRFIGHSTSQTKFDEDFRSRYVSCSLYNEDINDTFASQFGFIMAPKNIVGAKSEDMYVNNYASDQETLLSYTSIKKIDHPKRIIDECLKQKEKNRKEGSDKAVYSEVVIDGFEPIGIFCFTDGTKNLNRNYKDAQQLQKSFPKLKIKSFDIMKRKTGNELDKMKLNLLNNIKFQLTSSYYNIEISDLPRYDLFFEKFDELKKRGDYTEEEIESIFKYNQELLSIFDKEPEQLFAGKYNDIEIKYILGKNVKYNIDDILNGKMKAFSLNRLKDLVKYKDRLDKYYSGLGEFVELVSKLEVTDKMIKEIVALSPLNFLTMSKYLANILMPILNNKEARLKNELSQKKSKYLELVKEKEARQDTEKKYHFYSDVIFNKGYANILKKEYQELEKRIVLLQSKESDYVSKKEKIIKEIEKMIINKNELFVLDYRNSKEYQNIQAGIEILREERDVLKKHPIMNRRKIMAKDKAISLLDRQQNDNNANYNITKEENISSIDDKINELRVKIQFLEEQIKIKQEEKEISEIEMKNLQNKIHKYFKCNSVLEIDENLKQAKAFIENYDDNNCYYLNCIESELEKIENQIVVQENYLDDIQREKKTIGRS